MSKNDQQLPDSAIWFVRADKRNELSGYFLANGVVAMGWGIGRIDPVESREEIADRLRQRYPGTGQKLLSKWAREIREFNQDIGVGDAVATYEPRGRTYHIGVILSLLADPTEHAPLLERECEYVHRVAWLYKMGRDALPQGYAKRNFDLRTSLHRLSPEASAVLGRLCGDASTLTEELL